jgi:hypothetical protein
VGELWSGLARTLRRLEALALAPEQLADEGLDELRRLQYALHTASEDAVGLRPPPGVDAAHDELASALAEAREATGELAEAIEHDGAAALETRLYEWRGALFRIRLARLRLARPGEPAPAPGEAPSPARGPAAAALALTLGGTLAFLLGAAAGSWPLWAFGAAAVCSSLLVYRA